MPASDLPIATTIPLIVIQDSSRYGELPPETNRLVVILQKHHLTRDRGLMFCQLVLITGASPNSLGEAAAIALAGSEPGPKLLILASRTPSKLGAVAARVRGVVASRTSVDNDNPGSTAAAATAANKRSEAVDDSSTTAGGRAGDAGKGAATRVETVELDLASLGSVRAAAATIAGLTDSLDVLVNNAGISVSTRQVSPDGIELTFATNHVGPFLLTSLLLPLLLLLPLPDAAVKPVQGSHLGGGARAARRIVNVSSSGHRISPVRFSDYNFEHVDDERDDHRDKKTQEEPIGIPADELPHKSNPAWVLAAIDGFPGTVAYGASKSANILFTVALKRRLRSQGIESFAVDPGSEFLSILI